MTVAASPLWTAVEAVAATGGRSAVDWAVSGVSIDTRTLAPGDLFVALTGETRDGHEFALAALKAGAAAVLASRIPEGAPDGAPLLLTNDTLDGLNALGVAARARATQARVIGVTGSVGKTGTKDMLRAILSPVGATHAAEKSCNNHWGAPLTLARMPRETRFAIIELGMNHPGEITPLSRMARPDVAVITTVESVHAAAFASVEEIADAKAEIFAGVTAGATAVLNADNRFCARLANAARAAGAQVLTFGVSEDADARMIECGLSSGATVVKARILGYEIIYKIGAPGRHLAMNSLAALTAAVVVGGDLARGALELASWRAPAGRGAQFRVQLDRTGLDGAFTLIDESYNANPASMRAALEAFALAQPGFSPRRCGGRRIVFLGDMLELGPEEMDMHAGLADLKAMAAVDLVFAAGPRMRALYDALPADKRGAWAETSDDLAVRARRAVGAGDVAMVKGSLGARMARVVAALKSIGPVVSATAGEEEEA